jgi:zinc transport system ATP-binding protein
VTSLIHAKNLSVIHDGKAILDKVSLNISERDFITIIGPNGSGKSMLLKCIMGIQKASSGSISARPGVQIAYAPQDFTTENTLPISVKKFLSLNNTLSTEEFNNIAKETNISALLDRQVHSLSGGERQRVLLGRALAKKPNLLVLDEPAQNLDVNGQHAFYALIEEIFKNRNISILMVSHELHLVMACSNKVICLYHHICCSGTPQSVVQDPEFIKIFGTEMANRMAVYHHDHDHSHIHTHDESCQHFSHQHDHE